MNISEFAVNPTAPLHLKKPNGDLAYEGGDQTKPVIVNLYGPGSKQYARVQALQNNKMINRLKRNGKVELTPEEQAEEKAEFLAECVESWENIECNGMTGKAMSLHIFRNPAYVDLVRQVDEFIKEVSNFTNSSTAN
jgi:hypothetical protein